MEPDQDSHEFPIWAPHEDFYIQTMLFNATRVIRSAQAVDRTVREMIRADEHGETCEIDQLQCLDEVQQIALNAAALSKYFWPIGKKYLKRGDFLRRKFSVDNGSPLKNRDLRNSIEHLDEKMDDYFGNDAFSGYVFPEYFGFELDRDGPKTVFFRAYFIDTGQFEMLGNKFSVPELVSEVIRIYKLLRKKQQSGERI